MPSGGEGYLLYGSRPGSHVAAAHDRSDGVWQHADPRSSGLSWGAYTAATLAWPPCPSLRGWHPGLEPAEGCGQLGGLR